MVDFLNNPVAEFNELRIAFTNLVTTKAAEYSETVPTFVSNHSSELLYGSLSVFAAVTLAYLLGKLFGVSCERDMFKRLYSKELYEHEFWHAMFTGQVTTTEELESDVEDLKAERREMQDVINKLREERDAFEADLEEVRDDRDSFESNAEYWEEQYIDARNERDDFESDRDRLLERVELLEQMADTYKELVAEIETPQLRLAA